MKVRPKKHLGQHFLKDESIALQIAQTLTGIGQYKEVCEVGPGTGVLTKHLLKSEYNIKVVEVDTESIAFLQENYPQLDEKIIPADFLKLKLTDYFDPPFAVIGNFPYNISSQILFKVLENKELVPEVCGMFQKEVAERICAPEGSKVYGIISVLLQTYYNADYLFTVDKTAFNPPPKVQSGVIRLQRKENVKMPVPYSYYKGVVKMAFNQRRKTLRNALKALGVEIPEEYASKRAEQLSVEDFKTLSLKSYELNQNK